MESKMPFVPIFSASHVAKWPEDTGVVDQPERMVRNSQPDSCAPPVLSASKPKSHDHMAVKTHTWITLWFLVTAPVILWDASYCFYRPRSMVGGDLHWIWEPYGLYQTVDLVYGLKSLDENSGFPNAQSLLNLIETILNMAYVYLAHTSSWPGAPLVGFAAATMTLSKTMLYLAQEVYCGLCGVGHNALSDLVTLYLIPNGLWVLFPSMIVWRLGGDIVQSLVAASERVHKRA